MVKNATGGNRHKGLARKNEVSNNTKLRISDSDDEKYANVTKMFGNGMCEVLCHDNVTRICIIRGKFRGKGKRKNFVTLGAIVLVGTRDAWSSDSDKCDLLELYDLNELEQLKHIPSFPSHILSNNNQNNNNTDFEFSNSIVDNLIPTNHNHHDDNLPLNSNIIDIIDINDI
jgi:initiation factor 1A